MHWHIVLMKPPLLFNYPRPLFLELLEKVARGLDNVFSVDRRTLRDNVAVDEAFSLKKHQKRLLCPAGMDLCL
jgi:hypothetical protein